MKILRLQYRNFMGYKLVQLPDIEENFPEGLILINGPNSHGKSTIVEGMLYAFFGSRAFPGKKAEDFINYGEHEAEIYLYFELDNEKYYLHRKWNRSKKKSKQLFKYNLTSKKYREIPQFDIKDFFEITRNQALSTIFVKQGEVEKLSSMKGAEIREMILQLFQLDIIDKALKSLEDERKDREVKKDLLLKKRVPIERIEEDIEELKEKVEEDQKKFKNNEKVINNLKAKLQELPSAELFRQLETFYNELESSQDKLTSFIKRNDATLLEKGLNPEEFDSINKIQVKFDKKNEDLSKLEEEKKVLKEKYERINRGLSKPQGRISVSQKQLQRIQTELKFSSTETITCPLCESELTHDHYEQLLAKLNGNIVKDNQKVQNITKVLDKLRIDIDNYDTNIKKLTSELNVLENAKNDKEHIIAYEKEFEKNKSQLTNFLDANKKRFKHIELNREAIRSKSLEVERLTTELNGLENKIIELQQNIKDYCDKVNEKEKELIKMRQLHEQIGDLEVDLIHIGKVRELVRRFVTEYMVTKRLVKNIARVTEKYIRNFTLGQYGKLMIDLEGSRKTGLSLKIKDHFNGVNESVEMISGGDRTALGIALRLAISELMKTTRPTKNSPIKYPKMDFLLLDEPLAALDENRRKRILSYLLNSKNFPQIFLITHTEIPKELQLHQIIVAKDASTGISKAHFDKSAPIEF